MASVSVDKNPSKLVDNLRKTFNTGRTKPIEYRVEQLRSLERMLNENSEAIAQVLQEDLHKCKLESMYTEIWAALYEIENVLLHISEWAKPRIPETPVSILDSAYILHYPYGVVLVLGTWNYPVLTVLMPLIGAIAAGNCVLVKPSEVAPSTSKFLATTIEKYLDVDSYRVYEAGIPETTELLKEKFDYILYTGSSTVGKIIYAAAAKHLTPITLELGGKCPVYLDKTADICTAARRILWGKFMNAGQTCIAPDYILCPKEIEKELVDAFRVILEEFFGKDPKYCQDYGRIINERHVQRLANLLKDSSVVIGGEIDFTEKYIAPTVMINVRPSDPIMQQEIFGPVLPILSIDNANDAIQFIKSNEKPLALYIFSNNKRDVEEILSKTLAGGVTVNDTIVHSIVYSLPFGGIGNSGIGRYTGKYSFDTFSQRKRVLHKNVTSDRYPLYIKGTILYRKVVLIVQSSIFANFVFFLVGIAFSYLLYQLL